MERLLGFVSIYADDLAVLITNSIALSLNILSTPSKDIDCN